MKILIDECLPAALKENLTALGHECQTVRQAGFGSKKNGELLSRQVRWWRSGLRSQMVECSSDNNENSSTVTPHGGVWYSLMVEGTCNSSRN